MKKFAPAPQKTTLPWLRPTTAWVTVLMPAQMMLFRLGGLIAAGQRDPTITLIIVPRGGLANFWGAARTSLDEGQSVVAICQNENDARKIGQQFDVGVDEIFISPHTEK